MPKPFVILLGKAVRTATRLRGGGSAFPGLFIERIDSSFIKDTLSQLPRGVVVISGTNGKTTTTKMVVELLEGQGLSVFTNRTGSNFTRGVAAALLGEMTVNGKLTADIAVLELDEAHAVHFVKNVKPSHTLLLNVMRDQLDRFGEIDTTARLLESVANETSDTVVINREDPRLLEVATRINDKNVLFFGLDASLKKLFPSDDELRGPHAPAAKKLPKASGILMSVQDHTAVIRLNDHTLTATLKLDGIYNIFNAVAAVSLVSTVVGDKLNINKLVSTLETITPAFGRGEVITVEDQPFELVLVKNPSGFRLGLSSFDPSGYATMIAINDNYADGRDMSWLWDVDFESLSGGVSHVTGIRAFEMALRLQYDEIEIGTVEPTLVKALQSFISINKDVPKRVYCTYTAMLALRKELAKIADVRGIS